MIDAHIHLDGSELPPTLIEDGSRLGVTEFVGCSLGNYDEFPTPDAVRAANDDMYSVIQQHAQVRAYCYVNPRHGQEALTDFRRRVEEQGFVGLKLWIATLADDPLVFPFIEAAIEYRIPILAHAWRKTVTQFHYESTATNIAELARRYPDAAIIMAHLGGQVETAMDAVAGTPNVRVDTSGSPIGRGDVGIAVTRLGAERVIFGSDAPITTLAGSIGKLLDAELSDEQWRLITHDNMRGLLNGVRS